MLSRRRALLTGLAAGAVAAQPALAHYVNLRGQVVEDGKLTVGIALTGRPFAFREDGQLRGFELEFAAAVAHSRGLELKAVQVPRARLVETLLAGEVDLVNSFAFPGAAPDGIATVPYMAVGDHVMILRGNPFRIRRLEDLAGHTVSATMGTSAETFARELNRRFLAEGRAAMDIHTFPNQRDTHFPVSMGHAAAYFVASHSALVPTLDPDSRVRLFDGAFRPVREVGFALKAGQADLLDAVEHAIAAKVASGHYDRLRAAHGIPDELSLFREAG